MSNLLLCWRSSYTSLSSLNTARSTFIAELPLQVHSLLYISLVTLLSHHTHTPSLNPTTTHHSPPTTHLWTKIIPLQLFIIDPKMVMPQKCRLGNSTTIILRINGDWCCLGGASISWDSLFSICGSVVDIRWNCKLILQEIAECYPRCVFLSFWHSPEPTVS